MSTPLPEFKPFPKISRLHKPVVITEKIDGTNAQVLITEDGDVFAGSRTQWITPSNDNRGFARWVDGNKDLLLQLGPGTHFGEWWGQGIQRGYGLKEKRFSLFNVHRWVDHGKPVEPIAHDPVTKEPTAWQTQVPEGLFVVPVITTSIGACLNNAVDAAFRVLSEDGSYAAPGFMKPEGLIVFHTASQHLYKVTLDGDKK